MLLCSIMLAAALSILTCNICYGRINEQVVAYFFVYWTGIVVIGGALMWLWDRSVEKQKTTIDQKAKECLDSINALSFDEVKSRAMAVLNDEDKFYCVKARQKLPTHIAELGGDIAKLFGIYESINVLGFDDTLDWKLVNVADFNTNFYRVGQAFETGEYLVKKNDRKFFEGDPIGPVEIEEYRSVYHWILFMDQFYNDTPD